MESDKIIPKELSTKPNCTELIAPGTPIQFDMVLPATEFLDQNRGGRYSQLTFDIFDQTVCEERAIPFTTFVYGHSNQYG